MQHAPSEVCTGACLARSACKGRPTSPRRRPATPSFSSSFSSSSSSSASSSSSSSSSSSPL
eukprot:2008892-Pyramimonas_sp.AAC.1